MKSGTSKVDVYYHQKKVGTLALISQSNKVAFAYAKDWLNNGFALNPFYLPLKEDVFIPPTDYFNGLFGAFSDSQPEILGVNIFCIIFSKKKILI